MRTYFVRGCNGLGDFVTLVTVWELGSIFSDRDVGDFVKK